MRNSVRALALGAVLVLVLPGTVLGVATTSSRTETVVVLSSITMTGLPSAPLAWGFNVPGTTMTDAPSTIVVSTDDAAGYSVNWTHEVLVNGGGTIPLSAQKGRVTTAVVAADLVITAAWSGVFGAYPSADSLVAVTCGPICAATGASQTYAFTEQLTIPMGTKPGVYSGTMYYAALTL